MSDGGIHFSKGHHCVNIWIRELKFGITSSFELYFTWFKSKRDFGVGHLGNFSQTGRYGMESPYLKLYLIFMCRILAPLLRPYSPSETALTSRIMHCPAPHQWVLYETSGLPNIRDSVMIENASYCTNKFTIVYSIGR